MSIIEIKTGDLYLTFSMYEPNKYGVIGFIDGVRYYCTSIMAPFDILKDLLTSIAEHITYSIEWASLKVTIPSAFSIVEMTLHMDTGCELDRKLICYATECLGDNKRSIERLNKNSELLMEFLDNVKNDRIKYTELKKEDIPERLQIIENENGSVLNRLDLAWCVHQNAGIFEFDRSSRKAAE